MIGRSLQKARRYLEAGQVVALPTETVYGLGACIHCAHALRRIFAIKRRPLAHPLIVHIAHVRVMHDLVQDVPPLAYRLADVFWPGPLTMLLPRRACVSPLLTAQSPYVSLRVPGHAMFRQLLELLPQPVAAPSANIYQKISPTSAYDIEEAIGDQIPYILNGGTCQKGVESTLVSFENNTIVLHRHGAISCETLQNTVNTPIKIAANLCNKKYTNACVLPGTSERHYTPNIPLYIGDINAISKEHRHKQIGFLRFSTYLSNVSCNKQVILSRKGDLALACKRLYSAMRKLEAMGVDIIIAERMPNDGLGRTLNDRMQRACSNGH